MGLDSQACASRNTTVTGRVKRAGPLATLLLLFAGFAVLAAPIAYLLVVSSG